MMKMGWRGLMVAVMVGGLVACGGGGGGSGNPGSAVQGNTDAGAQSNVAAKPVMSFENATFNASSIEGTQGSVDGVITLSYSGSKTIIYWLEEPKDVVTDGQTYQIGQDRFTYHLVLSDKFAPGAYDTEVSVRACEADDSGNDCLPGAEISVNALKLHYVVKPNIHVVSAVALGRTGLEPAPSRTVAVDIPSEAGTVSMSLATSTPDALQAAFVNGQLTITTTQVRAGTYTGTVILQGSADAAYRRSVDISYTVTPPPGGEHDLSVDNPRTSATLQQGQSASVRVKVTRPTWTTQWSAPVLLNDQGLFSFRDLGNDEYEITANASNAASTSYRGVMRFNAGTPAGNVDAQFYVNVNQAFGVEGAFGPLIDNLYLTPSTNDADFTKSYRIVTFDGVPARWTATSNAAWAKLLTSSGTTGVDQLVIQIDKATAVQAFNGLSAQIEIVIDRPGTSPIRCAVSVDNALPRLTRVVGSALVGRSGKIYLDGFFPDFLTDLASVTVSGAQLSSKSFIQDKRLLGESKLLVLDVSQATPGQAITVSMSNNVLSTQVQVPVLDSVAAPGAYVTLPYGSYRPVHYSPVLRALYFSGEGAVFRWAHDSAAWNLSQVPVPGVIDVSPDTEAMALYGLVGRNVLKLDAVTLSTVGSGMYDRYAQAGSWNEFDPAAPAGMSALSFSSDGRAFASLISQGTFWAGMHGVAAIGGSATGVGQRSELVLGATQIDPGQRLRLFDSRPGVGAGSVRSAGGEAIVAQDPDGILWLYRASAREWSSLGQLPVNSTVAAVDDSGAVVVTTDGVLQGGKVSSKGSLANLLPVSYVASGYGLTKDGNTVLIYGYQIASETAGPRARDAAIWAVDITAFRSGATDLSAAKVLGRVSLPDAVGCTTSLVQGESCVHQASVAVSPTGLNAFVLGPRGLASVGLPSTWSTSGAAATSTSLISSFMQAASLRMGVGPTTSARKPSRLRGVLPGSVSR